MIYGHRVTKRYRDKLETVIEDLGLPNPVIRSYYRDGSIKQYVRDHLGLRTEATSNNTADFGLAKAVDTLPQLREAMAAVTDRYLTVQQDILETFVDRGQLRQLAEPSRPAWPIASGFQGLNSITRACWRSRMRSSASPRSRAAIPSRPGTCIRSQPPRST